MNLIFLGAPGAGKGTQAEVVSEALNIPQISTGNILREAAKNGTEYGLKAKAAMDSGALVSDEIVIGILKERKQFGRSIAQFQNTQFVLADLATKIEAAKLLVYKAARKKDEYQSGAKVSYSVEAAMAKLYAAEVAMEVTTKCVQLHGGYGYIKEYDVERMMRDAKITEIYEGTSEVQRMVISANLLK